MTKFAVLAALGVVSAQQEHGDHTHGDHQAHQEPTYYTIFDVIADEEPECEIDALSYMTQQDFAINLASELIKSGAKGFYHSE